MSDAPKALEYIRALRDNRTLTTSEKLAAAFMASHAGHDGTNAHPGIELLAAQIGLKDRQTKTLVSNLVKEGWLTQTSSGRGNSRYASVYALPIPQGATNCTLDTEPKCNPVQAKVQPTARQGATHCPTNQPGKSSFEIPVSQVSDLTDREEKKNDNQALTDGDGWEDCPSGEALVSNLNEVLADLRPGSQAFDPRFLRGGAQRLDELVRAVNANQIDMDDLITGLFGADDRFPEFGRADHDFNRVTDLARFVGKVMSGPVNTFVAYGLRGRSLAYAWGGATKADQAEAA